MTNLCPACERGHLTPQALDESFMYGGVELVAHDFEYSLCPVCGEEVVLEAQARRNEVRFSDAKRHHDDLLSSIEIIAWRNRWGLTQQQASALCGGGINAFSKYERGEVIQSRAMDLLIRGSDLLLDLREFLATRSGLQLPGTNWETIVDTDITVHSNIAASKPGCSIVDIAAYRIRQAACENEANDGEWHEEPELAYGH